jgi:hypothetical protein
MGIKTEALRAVGAAQLLITPYCPSSLAAI